MYIWHMGSRLYKSDLHASTIDTLSIRPSVTRRYFSGFERKGLDLVPSVFKIFGPLKKGVTRKQCEQNPKYSRLSSACFNPWRKFVLRRYTSIRTTVGKRLKYQQWPYGGLLYSTCYLYGMYTSKADEVISIRVLITVSNYFSCGGR